MHGTLRPAGASDEGYVGVAPPVRRRIPRWLPAVLLIAGILAAAWWMFKGRSGGDPARGGGAAVADASGKPGQAPPRVTVIVPGRTVVASTVNAVGAIAARRTSPIGVQGEGGMVTAVLVKEGDYVRRGQTLAVVDRGVQIQQIAQLEAGVRQAQADLALADADLRRAEALVSRGFISRADIDRRTATRDSNRARVEVTRAQVREMQARVARLDVRAPTAGIILTRAVEPGQVVGAGSAPLFTLAQDGRMEMRAQVAEQELQLVTIGQEATVQPVGATRAFTGRVWLNEPTVNAQNRQGMVHIDLGSDRSLRPGAFARAAIVAGSTDRPVLPQSSVLADDKGNYVLIVGADSKAARRAVEIGKVTAEGLVITEGLRGDERVVLSAAAFLNPGETVEPVLRSRG